VHGDDIEKVVQDQAVVAGAALLMTAVGEDLALKLLLQ